MRLIGRVCLAAACLLLARGPLRGEEDVERWLVYAGAHAFHWDTVGGPGGHTVDCRTEACDRSDFNRGNLDSSVGFRVGAERPFLEDHPLHFRAGAEVGLLFTEQDLSQHDRKLLDVLGVVAVGIDLGPLRSFLRAGAGGTLSDDGRARRAAFLETAFDVPLGPDAGLRLAARVTERNGPDGNDLSLLLITRGSNRRLEARWALDTQAGVSIPGGLVGEGRRLSRAPFWQIAAFREIGTGRTRLGLGVDIAGFESMVRTDFRGVSGNERSRDVFGFAALGDLEVAHTDRSRWRVGAGVKVADWRDAFNLLLDEDGDPILGSERELGALLKTEVVFRPESRYPILVGLEQVYWPGIDLGELRLRGGLQIVP